MNTNFTRWTSPVLGEEADKVYMKVYGENGKRFLDILESSPYEIAVISRLIAYMENKKREGSQNGYAENS